MARGIGRRDRLRPAATIKGERKRTRTPSGKLVRNKAVSRGDGDSSRCGRGDTCRERGVIRICLITDRIRASGTPLTVAQQDEFFGPNGHLAYRYTMLWTHMKRAETQGLETRHLVCSFEASLVVCRVFLEFLGLGVSYSQGGEPRLVEKRDYYSADGKTTDEVKVVDLGGTFAAPGDIAPAEQDLLAKVYHMRTRQPRISRIVRPS